MYELKWAKKLSIVLRVVYPDGSYSNWSQPIYYNVLDPRDSIIGSYDINYKISNTQVTEKIIIEKNEDYGIKTKINGTDLPYSFKAYPAPPSPTPGWNNHKNIYGGEYFGGVRFTPKANYDTVLIEGNDRNLNIGNYKGIKVK